MVRRKQSRAGFTLIEMLVVIGIIAILAAILFPVLSNARQKGYQTTCFSNLMNLGKAFNSYIADNSGYFPPWCASSPDPTAPPTPADAPDPNVWTWDKALATDYLQGKSSTLVCPSNPVPPVGTGAKQGLCRSYAMARYTQWTKVVRIGGTPHTVYVGGYQAKIPNPSQTVLLFEKGAYLPGSWDDALGENVHQSHNDKSGTDYSAAMFHFKGKNILFVDGSAKLFHEQEGPFKWDSGRTTPAGDQNIGPGVCELWGPAPTGDWPPLS